MLQKWEENRHTLANVLGHAQRRRKYLRDRDRRWRRLFNTVAYCVLVAASLVAPQCGHAGTSIDYQPGVRLGQGFEILDDSVRGECVEYEREESGVPNAQGHSEQYHMLEVVDSYHLAELMNLSLSAKYESAFGTSVEGKASIARKQKVTQFSNTFLARMSVQNPPQSIVGVKLKDAMALLAKTSPADFRQKCGNHFVSAVTTGGEFFGYVSIETRTKSEQEEISASYGAKYGLAGTFQSEGKVDKEFLETLENRRKTIEVQQRGGNSELVRDIDTMFRKLEGFSESVRGNGAVPYQATLQDYRTLQNFPASVDIGEREQALARILNRAFQLRSIDDDIRYIREHINEFSLASTSPAQLSELKNAIVSQLKLLDSAAAACKKPGSVCNAPDGPNPDDLRDRLPLRYRSICDPVDVTVDPFRINAYTRRGPGDNEMNGHSPFVLLSVELKPDAKNLFLDADLEIKESKYDWTTYVGNVKGSRVHTLNTAALEHCVYDPNQFQVLTGKIDSQAAADFHEPMHFGNGGGVLESADCLTDTYGDEDGDLYCDGITLRSPLRMRLKNEEDFFSVAQRKNENDLRRQRFKSIRLGNRDSTFPVIRDRPIIIFKPGAAQ